MIRIEYTSSENAIRMQYGDEMSLLSRELKIHLSKTKLLLGLDSEVLVRLRLLFRRLEALLILSRTYFRQVTWRLLKGCQQAWVHL